MKKIFFLSGIMLIAFTSCKSHKTVKDDLIKVEDGHFIRNGKPWYFIGANYWYGAILGSKGEGGNRTRLIKELDLLKADGAENLRVLAGAEDPGGDPQRVSPALQTAPGVYNKDLLEGLDFFLSELGKRHMTAVLYLNNNWTWSGGFSQYVAWTRKPDTTNARGNGRRRFGFMGGGSFYQNDSAKQLFRNHIKFMLNRINQITGIPYKDDPAIMAWELANEPRPASNNAEDEFTEWINETAAYVKSIDPNHLVTTGSEGEMGCANDIGLFEKIHRSKNIDYLTIHIWPFNWRWLNPRDMAGTIDQSIKNTQDYLDRHLAIARKLNKPVVIEEFGMGRDGYSYKPGTPVTFRDRYYNTCLKRVVESASDKDLLAGADFWAYGGIGKPNPERQNNMWGPGDDYLGDPPMEAQGLNSVFNDDPTVKIIKDYSKQVAKAAER